MKRNKVSSSRVMRHVGGRLDSNGQSRYGLKLAAGKQMYGGRGKESCCAHRLDPYTSPARSEHRGGMPNTLDTNGERVFIPKRAA